MSSRLHRYVPREHGAWAMLLVPLLAGTIQGAWSFWSALLLAAWLLAYLTSYFGSQWMRAARRSQFVGPLRLYFLLLLATGIPLVVMEPRLILALLAFTPFVAVNVYYARQKRSRSWQNGLASATAACLMAPLAYWFAGGTDGKLAASLFIVTWLYFVGTVLYVKTMIRERGNQRYLIASVTFHTIAIPIAISIDVWFAPLFALYLARAIVMPRHRMAPARVGALEIANSALLLAAISWLL